MDQIPVGTGESGPSALDPEPSTRPGNGAGVVTPACLFVPESRIVGGLEPRHWCRIRSHSTGR